MTIRRINDTLSYQDEAGKAQGAAVVVSEFPSSALTSANPSVARLRVDVGQTGFFDGREFRMVRKITAPIVFRFTFPIPVIVFEQLLTGSEGDMELYAWSASNVTPSGTWSPVVSFPKNAINTAYTPQYSIASGGAIAVTDAQQYRDYARVATAGATGQRFTIGGPSNSERYLAAGTYYVQITGTGVGSYSVMFEERP